jgi:hypothetical protein
MPSDRQSRRAVLLAMGIVCSTISTGCFTSPFVRRTPAPTPEPSSLPTAATGDRRDAQNTTKSGRVDSSVRSASVQPADVPVAGATLATPFLLAPGAASPAPAGEFPLELQAAPAGPTGKPAPSAPGNTAPAGNAEPTPATSTPLLDAAIQRVADVTRQQREAIASSASPESPDNRKQPQVPTAAGDKESPAPTAPASDHLAPDQDVVPLPSRISLSPEEDRPSAEPPSVEPRHASAPAHSSPPAGPPKLSPTRDAGAVPHAGSPAAAGRPEAGELSAEPSPPVETEPKANGVTAPEVDATDRAPADDQPSAGTVLALDREHVTPLGIGDLRLCRRVFGFGSFEPLGDERVKVGQHVLIYCELNGIQYEERGADYVSRISSRVEIKPARGGPVLWSRELGDAQDLCRRRRRDYYVNCVFDLPKTLGPGSYRLRLLQTDLVAGRSTSSDILLEIAP